jgi:hypothetical protein
LSGSGLASPRRDPPFRESEEGDDTLQRAGECVRQAQRLHANATHHYTFDDPWLRAGKAHRISLQQVR